VERWEKDFLFEGSTRFDHDRGVIGRTLTADVGPMEMEVRLVRIGEVIIDGVGSGLFRKIVAEVDAEPSSPFDPNGWPREGPTEHTGIEGGGGCSIVLSLFHCEIDLEILTGVRQLVRLHQITVR